jgi:hypothetical protein
MTGLECAVRLRPKCQAKGCRHPTPKRKGRTATSSALLGCRATRGIKHGPSLTLTAPKISAFMAG